MEQHNVLDVPENDLSLVQDVDGNTAAGVQMVQLVGGKSLHGFYKSLLSINQSLNKLTEEER